MMKFFSSKNDTRRSNHNSNSKIAGMYIMAGSNRDQTNTNEEGEGGSDLFGSSNNDMDNSLGDSQYTTSLTLNHKNQILAQRETQAVQCLRLTCLAVLLVTAAVVSSSVFLYIKHTERSNFTNQFQDAAITIMDSFQATIEQSLQAASMTSSSITMYALQNNLTFPYVTIPHFSILGSHLRTISKSHIVHWMPIVTDQQRPAWEEYALQQRFQIDQAFTADKDYRSSQDKEYNVQYPNATTTNNNIKRPTPNTTMTTILDDGTGYHPRIFANKKGVPMDEEEGAGPFMILWQRSPINPAKQRTLNTNWAKLPILAPDLIDTIQREKKAVINTASVPPSDYFKAGQEKNLRLSQYRGGQVNELINGPSTYLTYPVFDSLQEDGDTASQRQVKGVLATSIYWKVLFSRLLPQKAPPGILCVVENSLNQFFTFRIDGPKATFLGFGDKHDPKFDPHQYSPPLSSSSSSSRGGAGGDVGAADEDDDTDITATMNSYLQSKEGPHNRPYTSVTFSDAVTYKLRIYPSETTQSMFLTQTPLHYMLGFLSAFVFCSLLLILFSYVVEKRQSIMMKKVIANAKRATQAERELNEFLSHEVRNPLSAAMTACSFVTSALQQQEGTGGLDEDLNNPDTRRMVCEDLEVVNNSLGFINDFLRSMLDTHRASSQKLKINMAPTDIYRDVLQPVAAILYNRSAPFELVVVEEDYHTSLSSTNKNNHHHNHKDLVVMTDCIRLKQVVLNLARNATKFVEHGYIRLGVELVVVDHSSDDKPDPSLPQQQQRCRIYVEDSGPGIPKNKRNKIFGKYQESLDTLNQGTGIGLNLSKKLMKLMNDGDIWLDESYHSTIDGCPGARFVVELNACPMDMESTLLAYDDDDDDDDDDNNTYVAANVTSSTTAFNNNGNDNTSSHQYALQHGGGETTETTVTMDLSMNDMEQGKSVVQVPQPAMTNASASAPLFNMNIGTQVTPTVTAASSSDATIGMQPELAPPPPPPPPPPACAPLFNIINTGAQARGAPLFGAAENQLDSAPAPSHAPLFNASAGSQTTPSTTTASLFDVTGPPPGFGSPSASAPHPQSNAPGVLSPLAAQAQAKSAPLFSAGPPSSSLILPSPATHPTAAAAAAAVPTPPVVPAPSLSSLPRQPPKKQTSGGLALPPDLSVLFVDDDAVLRKLFVRSLKRVEPSWRIQEAACGETAIQICCGNDDQNNQSSPPSASTGPHSFDLIFMDQYMASVTKSLLGTETVQKLRAKGVKSKICGLSANDIRESFLKAGADNFKLKPLPCKPDQLRKLLFDLVGGVGT